MGDNGLFIRLRCGAGTGPVDVLDSLLQAGWTCDDHGVLRYLPLGDEDYEWGATAVTNLPQVMSELCAKQRAGEVIGLTLAFEGTSSGGEWLFFPNGELVFTPSVNRRITNGRSDVEWYLNRIMPAIQRVKASIVESWRWEETP